MKAGIVCDNYKVEAFKKMLVSNKFLFTIGPGITEDTTIFHVIYEKSQLEGLAILVKEVNKKNK